MILRAILPFFVLLLMASEASAQRWAKAETKHFIVYSDGSASQLEESALNLERIDALMRSLLRIPPEENPYKLDVYLMRTQNLVSAVAGSRGGTIAGFYRPSEEGTYIVGHRERNGRRSLPRQVVLFHEYAHHLMYRYFDNAYPAWYREGFAEYLSTAEFDDESFTIGAPAQHRAYSIRGGSYMPIELILSPPEDGFGDRGYMFYPQSWLLTHYMLSDSRRNKDLLRYFERLANGEDPVEAAEKTFGDLDELGDAVERYGRGKMEYRRSPEPMQIDGDVRIVEMDELQSELTEARLYIRSGYRLERVVRKLYELAEQHPDHAALWAELAEAERQLAHENDNFDFTKAHAAADRSLALDPDGELPNLKKALLLAEPADHRELDTESVNWEEVRAYAAKANAANADNPLALLTFIETFQHEGTAMPDIAIPAIEQVFGTVPEVLKVRILLAKLHAEAGNFDRALSLAGFMLADPHRGETGRRLVSTIKAMRDGLAPPIWEDEVEGADSAAD